MLVDSASRDQHCPATEQQPAAKEVFGGVQPLAKGLTNGTDGGDGVGTPPSLVSCPRPYFSRIGSGNIAYIELFKRNLIIADVKALLIKVSNSLEKCETSCIRNNNNLVHDVQLITN